MNRQSEGSRISIRSVVRAVAEHEGVGRLGPATLDDVDDSVALERRLARTGGGGVRGGIRVAFASRIY